MRISNSIYTFSVTYLFGCYKNCDNILQDSLIANF